MTTPALIRVRDRRAVHQFSIHNTVIDQWVPIIGVRGLALYNLYTRLANHRDERSYPGYTLITKHLGISKTSVSNYNQLMVWCGLIHIDPGTRSRSNDYYILDIPEVTPEILAAIQTQALAVLGEKAPFYRTLAKRLADWKPIQALWDAHKPALQVQVGGTPVEQGSTPVQQGGTPVEQGSTPVQQGGTPVEQGSTPVQQGGTPEVLEQSKATVQSNSPNGQYNSNNTPSDAAVVVSIFSDFGILEPALSEISTQVTELKALAWILYAESLTGIHNPAGFITSQVRRGNTPPQDFVMLAGIYDEDWDWLDRHYESRRHTGRWPDGVPVDLDLAEMWFSHHAARVDGQQ